MGEENFQIIGADGTRLRPPSLALPPSPIAGVSAETPLRHRSAGRARSDGRNHVPPVNPLLFRRRTGDGASSEKKRSPAADAGLGCRRRHPINGRTGGSGGHFALGTRAPRRPFCPLSAGGKWTPFSAPAGAEPSPAETPAIKVDPSFLPETVACAAVPRKTGFAGAPFD